MGVPAELTRGARARLPRRRGAALPTALFGLVVLSVLGAGIFSVGSVQRQATFNRESTARALLVAEEGIAHGVAVVRDSLRNRGYTRLLRGSDDVANTSDDGLIIGYGLSSGLQVPSAGKSTIDGSYTIAMRDDEGDPIGNPRIDGNHRIVMRCTGTTPDGASAIVDVVFGATPMPAFAVDGNLSISGGPRIYGACAGAHANESMTLSGGSIVSAGPITASQTVGGTATVRDASGNVVTPQGSQPQIEIPTLNPMEYCVAADYRLGSDGRLYNLSSGGSIDATLLPVNGWQRDLLTGVWRGQGGSLAGGTYCAEGNVWISGGTGSSTAPLPLTIFASGSVKVEGNPFLIPDYEDFSIVAGGDVYMAGNASGANENYEGSIYAGAQCRITGNPSIAGQVMCKDGAQPAGATDWVPSSMIDGNPVITYSCGSNLARRKILEWVQVSN